MQLFMQQLVNGIVLGATYGLVALGYTMVYGIVQLINFAHGEIFMLGAFGALFTYNELIPAGTPAVIAILLMLAGGMVVSVTAAVIMERFAYRPLRGAPRLAPLITALGVSIFLQELVRNFWPAKSDQSFPQLVDPTYQVSLGGGVAISLPKLITVIAAVVGMIALSTFVRGSRTGRAMQATAQDPDTAQLMGIDTNRIIVIAFAIGGFFAAVAAVAYGLRYGTVKYDMGFQMGLKAFTAAVLGGIGNIYGAMIGGLVLGLAETMATSYIDGIPGMQQLGGGGWSSVWAFVLLILVLLFRPQGLVGERVADRA